MKFSIRLALAATVSTLAALSPAFAQSARTAQAPVKDGP